MWPYYCRVISGGNNFLYERNYEIIKQLEQINTKQENWAHEREYRISLVPLFDDTYDTKEKRRLRYKFDNLEGLIFGINASEENKLNVKKILLDKCKKHNRKEFKMYQAIYNNVTGKIDIIPIIFNLQG